MPGLPADHRGPGVFAHLGAPESDRLSEQRRDDLAIALRAHL